MSLAGFGGEAEDRLREVIQKVAPTRAVEAAIGPGGTYRLAGELFGDGRLLVLATLEGIQPPGERGGYSATFGLAEWQQGAWQVRRLWPMPLQWALPDPLEDTDDLYPFRPANAPFWLAQLSPGTVPQIVVASTLHRRFQEFHLLALDRKNLPQAIAQADARPPLPRAGCASSTTVILAQKWSN